MSCATSRQKILAIIPARGGSKGLPGKNIIKLGGKPLIAWSIEAAQHSAVFDRVIVSTDDQKIAKVAKEYGAELPWLRPAKFAEDSSSIIDALVYEINKLQVEQNYIPDLIMLLQPTAPLRTSQDIIDAVELYCEKNASSVISVCEAQNHPYLVKKIDSEGKLLNFMEVSFPETQMNRQNLPPAYTLNGSIYLFRRDLFLKDKTLYGNPTYPYIMPQSRSYDIDTKEDLDFVRMQFEQIENRDNRE